MATPVICKKVTCCGSNAQGAEFGVFSYSLVAGNTYTNDELTFIIDCPPGYDCTGPSVTIVIPPGRVRFTPTDFDPNDPGNVPNDTYHFTCNNNTLTIVVSGGFGFTPAQIQSILALYAGCVATNHGYEVLNPTPHNPVIPTINVCNDTQSTTYTCPAFGEEITKTTPAGTICLEIPSNSTPDEVAAAKNTVNTQAFNQALLAAVLECQPFLNELVSVACPEGDENHTNVPIDGDGIYIMDGTVFAAAGYYSSPTSQQEANDIATAAAQTRFDTYVANNVIVCASACGSVNDIQYLGQSGLIDTGLSAVLAEAEFRTGAPSNGYSCNVIVNGEPKIAVLEMNWGPSMTFNWLLYCSTDSADGKAFAGYLTAFNNTPDKTLRIPVFPYGTVTSATLPDGGATGPDMGDCICNVTLVCPGVSEALLIAWDAPTIDQINDGTASASVLGGTFNAAVDNPGGVLDEANVYLTGTFTVTNVGVAGKLTLSVSNLLFDGGGDWPKVHIEATSDIDGSVWSSFSDNTPAWFGNGVIAIPFVFGCTPGSVITLTVSVETVTGPFDPQSVTIAGSIGTWP